MPLPIPESSSRAVATQFYTDHPEIDKDLNNFGLLFEYFVDTIANGDYAHTHFKTEDVTPIFYKILANKWIELKKSISDPFNGEGKFDGPMLIEIVKDIFSLLESYFSKTPIGYDSEPVGVDVGHYKATFKLGKEKFSKYKEDFAKIIDNENTN